MLALFAALIATAAGPAMARDLGWNWAWQAHEAAQRQSERQQDRVYRQSAATPPAAVRKAAGGNTQEDDN
jgi:hypothetical protein